MAPGKPARHHNPEFRGYVRGVLKELSSRSPSYWVAATEMDRTLLADTGFRDRFRLNYPVGSFNPDTFLSYMTELGEIGMIRAKAGSHIRKLFRHEQPESVFKLPRPRPGEIAGDVILKALYDIDTYEDGFFYSADAVWKFIGNGLTRPFVGEALDLGVKGGTVEHAEASRGQRLFRLPMGCADGPGFSRRPVNTRHSASIAWNRPKY